MRVYKTKYQNRKYNYYMCTRNKEEKKRIFNKIKTEIYIYKLNVYIIYYILYGTI